MKKLFTAFQRMLVGLSLAVAKGLSSRRCLVGVGYSGSESFAPVTERQARDEREMKRNSRTDKDKRNCLYRSKCGARVSGANIELLTVRQNGTAKVYQGYSKGIRFAATILVLLWIGVGNVWGAVYTMTPDNSTTGNSSTSYVTSETSFTSNTIGWKINQWNPNTLQVKTNQSTKTSEFYFYNTSAFSGNITQVVVTFSALTLSNTSESGWYLSKGTSQVGTTSLSTTGSIQGVWNSTYKTLTFTVTGDCTYFTIWQNGKVATGTNNLASSNAISVTYAAGPSITTSVSSLSDVGYSTDDFSQQVKSFTVSGSSLTANVTVTAPTNYEVCKTLDGTYTSSVSFDKGSGTLSAQTVYVRLQSGKTAGSYSGNVACTSDGATTKNVAVSGSVPFTVTWKANGATHATTYVAYATSPGTALGSLPDDPDPSDYTCTPKAFFGWYEGDYSNASTAPTCITTATKITADKTYNAVFATATPGDGSASVKSTGGFPVSFTTSNYSSGTSNGVGTATITANTGSATITLNDNATGIYFAQKASGAYWLFTIPVSSFSASDSITLALSGVKVSNTDYKFTYKFQYSTNGSSYTDFGSSYTETTSATAVTRGIKIGSSLLTGNIYIKILSTSGGGTKGGNHYINSASITCHTISETTYSNYATSCCTALGSINGSVAWTNPTEAVVSWDNIEGVSSWTVEHKTGDGAYSTTGVSADEAYTKVSTNDSRRVTITGLSCGTEYDFRITPTPSYGYCSADPDVVNSTSSKYAITLASSGSVTGGSFSVWNEAMDNELTTACNGETLVLNADKSDGYDFTTWVITNTSTSADVTTTVLGSSNEDEAIVEMTMPAYDVTVNATFSPQTYTITYYDGDAENASKTFSGNLADGYPITHTYATATTLKSATKSGFNFGGWYDNKECEGDPITSLGATSYIADIVLYAKWIDDSKWTVTIGSHANGSLSVTYTGMESALTSGSREIEKNTVLTISATPNTGYTLTNLTVGDDDDFTSGGTHTLTGNITVSATFSAINYTITYNLNGGVNHGDNVASYTIEDEVVFEDPTKTGYHFDGWFTDAEFDPESEIMWIDEGSTGNVVVYAKWSANSYDVTLKLNGGTGSDQVVSATYDAAMPTTVKTAGTAIVIPTREGYTFTGWWDATSGGNKYYNANGTSARTWNVAEATNLYAQWSINAYNVAVSAVGDVTISATSPSIAEGGNADVNYGATVTLSYSGVTSGIYWGEWKVYKSDEESTTVTVTNNQFSMPAYDVVVSAVLFGDAIAWCDPDVSVTGDIHLTSYKDIYVNSTSGAGNLINITSSDLGSATEIEVAYKNGEELVEDKDESVFRLCNDGSSNYNVIDESALNISTARTLLANHYSIKYTPNAYDQRDNYKLQLTFKKGEQVLKTVEHNLYGRALPEEFVIASKYNGKWYAFPNTMGTSLQSVTPIRISVDNMDTPEAASFAPSTTVYKGAARKTAGSNVNSIRLTPNGENWLTVSSTTGTNTMSLPTTETTDYENRQVWYLKSTDFSAYEVKRDPAQGSDKKLGMANATSMGYYASPAGTSGQIYLLPIDDNGKYADLALTDIDWTDDDFGFTATTSATQAAVQIEDGTRTALVDLHSGEGNVHAANLYTQVDFTNKEGQNVLLTLYDNNGDILEGAQVTIPSIVTTTATAWGSIATEPTLDNIVVLKGDMVVSQKDAAAKSIVLDGGKLEIAAGAALVMDGNVKKFDGELFRQTAVGDVALRSTKAAGTGALIINPANVTVAPKATVEQATKTGKIDGQKINQYIGTPFSDGNGYSNWYGSYAYYLNAANNSWVNLKSNNAALDAFKGYMIMRDDETTFWMQGTLVKPSVSNTVLTLTPRDDVRQSNLLANSWSGPIDIKTMETTDFEGADPTIYLFNAGTKAQNEADGAAAHSAGQWTTLSVEAVKATPSLFPITVIPSMQGFIVLAHSDGDTHTVTLNYDRMVYQPALDSIGVTGKGVQVKPNRAPEMRQTAADSPEVLKLIVSGESGASDNVLLFVREDFTTGFDNGWDGRKMTGSAWAPKMYAVSDDGNMAIHAVPEVEGTVIGFRAGQDNNYTFTFRYEGNDVLYLNDMLTETSTRIHEGFSYDFTTAEGDIETRFVISHTPFVKTTPTGLDNVQGDEGQSVRKLFFQGVMYIIRGGKIYNASGERVK